MDATHRNGPIAVFDSGLGGLTVVRALRRWLPEENVVYFGDTARVPYGHKSRETVTRFAAENCRFLMRFNPKCIVAACNTVSAVALPHIADQFPLPVLGVVEPGAAQAIAARQRGGVMAVLGTEATIASNAYRTAITQLDPRAAVVQIACPLFVALVEEGRRADDPLVRLTVADYLEPVLRLDPAVVVLGCTHYPMIRPAIERFFGPACAVVDSADATATQVRRLLAGDNALSTGVETGRLLCYVSDNPQRFQAVGSHFLGEAIKDVVRVCPEELCDEQDLSKPSPQRLIA